MEYNYFMPKIFTREFFVKKGTEGGHKLFRERGAAFMRMMNAKSQKVRKAKKKLKEKHA